MSKKNEFSRYFSGISYLPSEIVNRVLVDKTKSIRSFAFILHDKDLDDDGNLKIAHVHFVIRTYSSWSCEQISKWFKGFNDEEGKPINTLVQIAHDVGSCLEYLTHDGIDGKYHYQRDEIHSFNVSDLQVKRDSKDDSLEICEAIIRGVSTRELVKRYGRDFIYHRKAYQEVCFDISIEERIYDD